MRNLRREAWLASGLTLLLGFVSFGMESDLESGNETLVFNDTYLFGTFQTTVTP